MWENTLSVFPMMMFLRSGRDTLRKTYSGAGRAFSFLTGEVRGLQAAAYILALSSLVALGGALYLRRAVR